MQVFLVVVMALLGCTLAESEPDQSWALVDAGLYYQVNNSEKVESGSEGLLIVHFIIKGEPENTWKSGTVCDDSFTSHAANLTCQYLGYSHVEMWGSSSRSDRYISEELLDRADIHTLIDEVECSEADRNILNCSADIMVGHDCSRSEDIWLQCSEPQWQVTDAALTHLSNRTKNLEFGGSEGLLLVQVEDGKSRQWGTVCDDYFDDLAANLSCRGLGYEYAEGWGSEPGNSRYVPRSVLEEIGIPVLVDDVQCDEWATSISLCEAKVGPDNDCDRSEDIWLRCKSGKDDEDDHDEDDDDDDEQGGGGILDFGGGKVTLNLNKFHRKWRF